MKQVESQQYIASIGGVFIYSKDPAALAAWYTKTLGLEFESDTEKGAFYLSFYYWDQDNKEKKRLVAWSIMKKDELDDNQPRQFMVNYRVKDMNKLVNHLKSLNIDIEGPNEYPGEGKFGWIHDIDGNKIELWEDGFSL